MPQSGTNPSRPTLRIQLEIYGIREVDAMAGTVSFKSAFRQYWNDTRLTWDPNNFGGIQYIWLSSDSNNDKRSWVSDMSIRQDAGENEMNSNLKMTQVRVHYSGLCYFSQFGDVKVMSSFDLSKYPFDVQQIDMTFGSWLVTDDRLHLELYDPPFIVQSPKNWIIANIEWQFTDYWVTTIKSNAASGFYLRY